MRSLSSQPPVPQPLPYTTGTSPATRAWLGWALALFASFAFSFAAPIARGVILSGVDSTTILVWRLSLATLFFGITIAVMDWRLFLVSRQTLVVTIFAGATNGLGMLFFFWALERVDASISAMIISLIPLVVLSLLALRGERFTYRHVIRLGLGLGGVYLLIGPGGTVDPHGILLLVTAILCFSCQIVLLQWYLKGQDFRSVSFYISAGMTVVVLAYGFLHGTSWQVSSVQNWLLVFALAFLSTFVARLAFVAAVDRIGGGQMTLLTPLETLLTVTWSLVFLHERFTVVQWVGGAFVLASALLAVQRLNLAQWRPRWRNWTRV
ncbi:MAG: DMT family transporter [Caldilineaceae bacterium]|nr:DMT family transporter [Caldilineaceae bacterium]